MRAGDLTTRVQLQQDTGASLDAAGNRIPSWATVVSRWADIESIAGGETFRAGKVQVEVTHTITLRSYPDLSPTAWRIYDGTTYYYPVRVVTDAVETVATCRSA